MSMLETPKMAALRRIKTKKTRKVNTYAELWRTASNLYWKGVDDKIGASYQFLASSMFSAFTIEAYLNHLGEQVIPDWINIEKAMSPVQKLCLLYEHLKVPYDPGKRPVQTIRELFIFRDQLAHGRSVTLTEEPALKLHDNFLDRLHEPILTEMERWQNEAKATRVREDAEEVMKSLHSKCPDPDDILFDSGEWSGTATV